MRPDGSVSIRSGTEATLDDITVAVAGRPRWAGETAVLTAGSAALSIARAFKAQGPDLLARLQGSFALAVVDGRQRRGFVAIDRVGICPLHHARLADGSFLFATGLRELVEFAGQPLSLDLQALFDFTFLHMMAIDSRGNLYAGETIGGRRIQKFTRTSNCPGNSEGHGGAGLYQCPGNK